MISARCYMQLLRESDFPDVLGMFSDPGAWTYIRPWQGKTKAEYSAFLELKLKEIRSNTGYYWLIRENESQALIGAINVTPIPKTDRMQIGWMVRPLFQRKGFAFEGARMAMEYILKKTEINPIYIVYDKDNIASEKIAKKLRFRYEKSFLEVDRVLYTYIFRRSGNT